MLLVLIFVTLFSCSKDTDLFYQSIEDEIVENIEEETVEEDAQNPPNGEEGGNADVDEEQPTDFITGSLKAFPSAVGFGSNATGGRGGKVIKVTNLNDSGPGSFRAACEESGPRIVIFDVGGTINLSSSVTIENDDITVAGQSAPTDSGGITISGASIRIFASNVIFRYVRIRVGDGGYKNANGAIVGGNSDDYDGLSLFGSRGGDLMIFDHCSISWAIDENVGMAGSSSDPLENITIQNSIISEALDASHHDKGAHSKGALIGLNTQKVTFYKNLLAHNSERNVRSGGGNSFEMINNVVYNFGYASGISSGNVFTVIGNYYKSGVDGAKSSNPQMIDYIADNSYPLSSTQPYISDNYFDVPGNSVEYDTTYDAVMKGVPPISSNITATSALAIVEDVLGNSGSNYPHVDSVDERVINEFRNGTGRIIDTQAQVGGFPSLAMGTPKVDSDGDGMPDGWEIANGFNPNVDDSAGDSDDNGYTNIEEYLYSLTQD
ncbi:pectate lyase family protein [Flagellimonas marinaquae]|uniref:pectate lyase family protein n=1 Tax=Flagellimonas marinaquae TaxID=254955 RepID=UPI00207593CD|nr:hypothetical protein [Allomuricauda aquimarina]USD24828.1 hypothetical protein MJO53_14205 [Allomuricauda aquimarina]